MSRIKVLPDIVANKIAAGEVVERPASAVKELVENAIDAGATRITVDIEAGGRRLIRVSDNGSGMGREDALLSIERHATSKIADIHDIGRISTLGFRGEALPSIVSVSKAVIETKREEDMFGTRLVINGGVLKDVSDVGRDEGTLVEVRNLFFNVPARRKFLRSDDTELRHIKRMIYDVAVSMPSISLTLNTDGREIFRFTGSEDHEDMLRQIFGETATRLMTPFELEAEDLTVTGFLGKPETARNTSVHQYVVMNGRPIDSKSLSRAVRDGYGQTVQRGMFPAFILYFELDPARIDVNVHPSKREIKIHREFVIAQEIRGNVAMTIQSMSSAPELGTSSRFLEDSLTGSRPVTVYNPPEQRWMADVPKDRSAAQSDTAQTTLDLAFKAPETTSQPAVPAASENYDSSRQAFWQLKDRYILSTVKEGAIIVDQHVAHERILYEEVLGYFNGRQAAAQQLLFPLLVDFPAADYDIIEKMLPFLNQVGFGVREFGERSIMVDAVPSWYKGDDNGAIFTEYIDEMRRHGRISSGYIEKLAAAIACRSAIKSGKPLNQEEMRYLIDRLFATSSPFVCPHGRPIIVKLTLDELDRRFGRA